MLRKFCAHYTMDIAISQGLIFMRFSFSSFSLLWPYIRQSRKLVLGAICFLIIASFATLSLPLTIGSMLNHVFSGESSITPYFFILLGIVIMMAASSALRYYFVMSLGETIVSRLQIDVFNKLIYLPVSFFDRMHSGDLISRLSSDITMVKSLVGVRASMVLRNLIMGIGSLVMLFITNVKLSILVLVCAPLIVFVFMFFGPKLRKRTRSVQDKVAETNVYASEQLGAIRTVKAFTMEEKSSKKYTKINLEGLSIVRSSIFLRAWVTGITIFLIFTSIFLILTMGAIAVLNGKLSAGALGQFVLYAIMAASSFGQLSEATADFSQISGAISRLDEIMQETTIIPNNKNDVLSLPEPMRGELNVQHVGFSYQNREKNIALDDINFNIMPGETVAIVGESGAGKTTLFALLQGFYEPQTGVIEVDGIDIQKANQLEVRERFSVVSQHVDIFSGSIFDNITFGTSNCDMEDVERVAKAAHAHDFIMALPDQYQSWVGENGLTLSGGQRQRIAIARALLRPAPILLLDEATSALDANSEKYVQSALEYLMNKRTTLVIAHRLSTIINADRILVMHQGKIVEEGTHQQLLSKNGDYAKLARSQLHLTEENVYA